jgi:PiT family inorganic phosphate transporter
VQWKVVREMMMAWVITIPLALGISWAGYQIISFAFTVL